MAKIYRSRLRTRVAVISEGSLSAGGGQPPTGATNSALRKLQIAELVGDGLTNREIGERLFLSDRTIGSHLYRIFPKLGIKSRSKLAVVARQTR